ncbi:MAG: lyase [Acidimicrobiia bacterium]
MRVRHLLAISTLTLGACTTAIPSSSTVGEPVVSTVDLEVTTTTVTTPSDGPATTTSTAIPVETLTIEVFPVPAGSRPHDVAPALDGGVWYTAQGLGELGWLDPETGETRQIPLGPGSRPHGVIIDSAGIPWVTDGGLNAIVSVNPDTGESTIFPLPDDTSDANLNTATFAADGTLWFTGQNGIYGALDVETGETQIFQAPGGRGPYGITTTPDGTIFYASLAGSFVGLVDEDGSTVVLDPPTPNQGARRVWSDSVGTIWVSEWNTGQLSRYVPGTDEWSSWLLPGETPAAYAVYVDELDIVWLSDFGSNSLVRFDPTSEVFTTYPLPHDPGDVRQILGRPGEVWGAESAADHLVLIRTR